MRKRTHWFCGVIAALLLLPAEALCDGYGFYGWGRGWPSIGVPDAVEDIAPEFKDLEIDLRHDHFTIGYLYDSASTPEERFGWRFNFGVDIVVTNFDGMSGPNLGGIGFGFDDMASNLYDATGYGFAAKFAYGIGVLRTDRVRVWVGPSVRLNADYVDQKSDSFTQGPLSVEMDPWGIIMSVGGGIEAGVRYNIASDVSLDFSTGFHYNFFGYYQDTNLKINSQSVGSDNSFFTGDEPFVFVQIALRFDFSKDEDAP